MKTKALQELLDRVEAWPPEKQDAFATLVQDFETDFDQPYEPSPDEIAGIERGLVAAREGRIASQAAVDAVLRKLRNS